MSDVMEISDSGFQVIRRCVQNFGVCKFMDHNITWMAQNAAKAMGGMVVICTPAFAVMWIGTFANCALAALSKKAIFPLLLRNAVKTLDMPPAVHAGASLFSSP